MIVSPVTVSGATVGGIIVLAIMWTKLRPLIIIRTKDGVKFFFGVSHSKKRKNMKKLTESGVEGISVDEDTSYGLCNTPSEIKKEIGTVSVEKAQELLDSVEDKKATKITTRKKSSR